MAATTQHHDLVNITCFRCGKKGHYQTNCPTHSSTSTPALTTTDKSLKGDQASLANLEEAHFELEADLFWKASRGIFSFYCSFHCLQGYVGINLWSNSSIPISNYAPTSVNDKKKFRVSHSFHCFLSFWKVLETWKPEKDYKSTTKCKSGP